MKTKTLSTMKTIVTIFLLVLIAVPVTYAQTISAKTSKVSVDFSDPKSDTNSSFPGISWVTPINETVFSKDTKIEIKFNVVSRHKLSKVTINVREKDAAEVRVLSREEVPSAGNTPCDLLINATPIGMFPKIEESPVAGTIAADVVFDMVYNPATTRLLKEAASQGKTTVSGTRMFFAQAARQFEIWTKQPAPREVYAAE